MLTGEREGERERERREERRNRLGTNGMEWNGVKTETRGRNSGCPKKKKGQRANDLSVRVFFFFGTHALLHYCVLEAYVLLLSFSFHPHDAPLAYLSSIRCARTHMAHGTTANANSKVPREITKKDIDAGPGTLVVCLGCKKIHWFLTSYYFTCLSCPSSFPSSLTSSCPRRSLHLPPTRPAMLESSWSGYSRPHPCPQH